ncbi:PEP-CTERM sorting domain-containing protein [Eleftheria terrae]|uniref:PEP-CTERM sorting domain-containing protein n=1 Tax=Eleftheria terrae TaxID=1597781 RepID=UPI00263A511C|nr:PEP-CTERM sorting domain-containing protein [Eleftheria terrae]WKB55999.1 PEP-CTERM sorting domain-containing protein [Eleftheria terrae]
MPAFLGLRRKLAVLAAFLIAAASSAVEVATASTPAKELIIGAAISESVSLPFTALSYLEVVDLAEVPQLEVSGGYTDNGFTTLVQGDIGGTIYSHSQSATVEGNVGEDITIHIAGTGSLGQQAFSETATIVWHYDTAAADYVGFEFESSGGIADSFASSASTAGLKSWFNKVVGRGSGVIKGVLDFFTQGETGTTDKPSVIIKQNIKGDKNKVKKNIRVGEGLDVEGGLDGTRFAGVTTPVPEPSTWLLLVLGGGLLVARGRWSARRKLGPIEPALI